MLALYISSVWAPGMRNLLQWHVAAARICPCSRVMAGQPQVLVLEIIKVHELLAVGSVRVCGMEHWQCLLWLSPRSRPDGLHTVQ